MKDFLRKNSSRGSTESSSAGGNRPSSPLLTEQTNQSKDGSAVGKFASAFKMRAFRGSVRKKVSELETCTTSKDILVLPDDNDKTATTPLKSLAGNSPAGDPLHTLCQESQHTDDSVKGKGETQDLSDEAEEEVHGEAEEAEKNDDNTESEAESTYESRKLMMRRVVRHEAQEAKQGLAPEHLSDADSWADLEESFAKVYEPIPYQVRMEAWHKMNKEEMLHRINSQRMRSQLKNMSRKEILEQIGYLREHPVHFVQNSGKLKNLEEVRGDQPQPADTPRQHQVVAQVHSPQHNSQTLQSDTDSEFGETDYVTRSELYRNIQNLQDSLARHNKMNIAEDNQSWRSLPSQPDDPVYISRSEILSKVDPAYVSRPEVTRAREVELQKKSGKDSTYVSRSEILMRLKEMRESEDERGLSPTNTAESNWDLCSCVSCEQCGADNSSAFEAECQCSAKQAMDKRHEELTNPSRPMTPGDQSLLSQDSWSNGEFEKIYEPINGPGVTTRQHDYLVSRTLEEQEKRLRKLAQAEEHLSSGRGKYLPVDVWSISESEDVYESLARVARASIRGGTSTLASVSKTRNKTGGGGDLELQRRLREILNGQQHINTATRNKVVKAITEHIQLNLDLDDFADEEERNHEIRERLKEALAQDWETLSNINLGHIYVPMEESSKSSKQGSRENTDYDTFGSIDSLIFEPKVPAIPEVSDEATVSSAISNAISVDSLMDKTLEQSQDDVAQSALKLLAETLEEMDEMGTYSRGDVEEEEENESETPVPTPIPSTPLVESEQELPVCDTDDDSQRQEHEVSDILHIPSNGGALPGKQHQWPWGVGDQEGRGRAQAPKDNPKLPLKQKIYNGLMGLGFIRFGSRENVKTSSQASNRNDVNLNVSGTDTPTSEESSRLPMMMKLQRELDSRQSQKDLHGYESFKMDFQRLSGKRLPSEEGSSYEYHPDHSEPLYHGGTTTSHDTGDSETDSVTSLESVIFKGAIVEKDSDLDLEDKKKKKNPFRHKFVVNQGNESDTSELHENKSVSLSTQPYLDSDTSWDYMEALDEEKAAMQRYAAAVEAQAERTSVTPGPRVFGNMRRKHVYESMDSIERSQAEMDEYPLQTASGEGLANFEDIGDRTSPASPAGLHIPFVDGNSATNSVDEEADGRQLFRLYQRRQFRPPSDLGQLDGGGSTSTSTNDYHETDVYEVCPSSSGLVQHVQDTPPVVLLKHHVYQSIESLASRSCLSSTPSVKTPVTVGTLEDGELQFYGSRHGEPIYGVRNSRLFHSMNGAFVSRDSTIDVADPPVVIRKGKVVELTEEMFKGSLDRALSRELEENQQNMTFHTTLLPASLHQEDRLYFDNTVSSTESREIHSYENDSEIYGTRREIREEILRASKQQLVGEAEEKGSAKEELSAEVPAAVGNGENLRDEELGGTSTEKIKRVQKLGVSILGSNNDMMIRELKLKLRRRFNPDDDVNSEEETIEKPSLVKHLSSGKGPLTATMSSDSTNSVALKREQLAPHMSKIFGSLYERRRQSVDAGVIIENEVRDKEDESKESLSAESDSRKDTKEEKQEKNEKEKKNKEREVIMVEREDGLLERVYLPTPDYTPASTLPKDNHNRTILAFDHLMDPQMTEEEDYSFDLADLAKFVHEHISKNKSLYSDPGGLNATPTPIAQVSTSVSPSPMECPNRDGGEGGTRKRSVRFDMSRKLADLGATWSDLESVIFAEEKSGSELLDGLENEYSGSMLLTGKLPVSRMESYKDSDWLLWEQLAKMRRSKAPEDRERWELEKTKRMLLWIHLSNNNAYTEWCYKSQWWKAKQRASVAWIVQKAHKNKVPTDLQDPYYRDYEGAEHLKPGIVHRLANADLYCSALANIYGDPNFHNLSHWNIIQALARKGVYVAEPTDVALTETVLIQVTPIKMSAHLAVIEAMMALYIREVVVADRAVVVLQRVSGGVTPERTPQDQEEALVMWISYVTQALQERIHQQVQSQDQELPVFPRIQDLSDLSDGIGLAALIAFYCPQELPWGDIAVADPPSIADSLYNIGLVIRFCQESLPYNPCLLTKEDIVYMHSSVKQNVLAFAAELFFLLELEPVSCVSLPGTKKTSTKFIQLSSPGRGGGKSPSSGGSGTGTGTGTGLRRQQSLTERDRPRRDRVSIHEGMKPAGTPSVRRSHSMNLNDMTDLRSRIEQRTDRSENAPSSYNSDYGGRDSSMSDGQEGDFIVQRSRGLATLSDMMRTQSPRPSHDTDVSYSSRSATKERYNMDSKEEELGERSRGLGRRGSFNNSHPDLPAAGMPSRYEERPHGRSRSRRNSFSAEDSQLTIENFGGSQDNLNYISRNPDKEPFVHTGRRENSHLEGSQSRDSREGSIRPESRGSRERSVERRLDLHRGSIEELDNRLVDKLEREALEREKRDLSHYTSKERLMVRDPRKISMDVMDSGSESDLSFDREKQMVKATSFAELSKLKEQLPGSINIIYMQSDKEDTAKRSNKGSEKKTTFAALPNQTTWKQQSAQCHSDDNKSVSDENMEPQVMASELHNVRLKLEEKRRRIEAEKRKMEQAMSKQRQKLGKEAFMQAVVKGGKGSSTGSSTPTTSEPDALDAMVDSVEQSLPKHPSSITTTATPPNPDLSLKDIGSDVNNLSRRWLEGETQTDELRTPDLDAMDYDQYHQSLTQMTDSLTEIQGDIQRLSHQQQQIQSLMHNGMNPPTNQAMQQQPPHGQFYLHDQGSPVRRMWGQQSGSDGYASMSPATRRAQWGPARPMMPQTDYMMAGQHPNYYSGYQMNHPAQVPPLSQMNTQPQVGNTSHGFMLHGQTQSLPPQAMYQNGQGYYSPEHQFRGYPPSAQTYGSSDQQRQMGQTPPFRLHSESTGADGWGPGGESRGPGSLRSSAQSSPSRQVPQRQQKSPSPTRQASVSHAPVAAPPPDDMEPQNVSFINSTDQQHSENQKDNISDRFKRLSITSGSKTYRISHEPGSPTRPSLGVKTFRVPTKKGTPVYDDVDLPQPAPPQRSRTPPYHQDSGGLDDDEDELVIKAEPLQEGPKGDKGFYISFDSDSGPRKPKPQLRNKKMYRKNSSPSTPATTPSREDLPVVPDRPSRTSNGSFDPQRGSMTQTHSPSMAQSPFTLSSHRSNLKSGYLSPQTNGLSHNSPLETEREEEHEPHSEVPLEEMTPYSSKSQLTEPTAGMALVIGEDLVNSERSTASEMEKKKERLMMLSMKRKQEQEEARLKKEMEAQEKREAEKLKEEEKQRKKEEEKARRQIILERYKIKKAMEEAEKEGRYYEPPPGMSPDPPSSSQGKSSVRLRNKPPGGTRPRPKTMAGSSVTDATDGELTPSRDKKGSSQNIAEFGRRGEGSRSGSMRKSSGRWGSSQSLSRAAGSRGSSSSLAGDYPSTTRTLDRGHTGRRPTSVIGYSSVARGDSRKASLYGSQGDGLNYDEDYRVHAARRPSLASESAGSRLRRGYASNSNGGSAGYRKYRSTGNLSGQSEHDSLVYHMSEDSGLGRATPPRRAPSPGMARHLPSPSGPGSLPPGLFSKRKQGGFDDAASDISSTASSTMDYYGPKLFKQPTAKSNRTIILNAVEYCVFPGMVNQTAKQRVLEEIARSESKHFLILFRDAGCQFRAIYSFNPETDEVYKLYGTGPKQVNDRMFDKFFKYNSGGKCFSQIHTKHLTVTIDAFTIHNSLWQGKRVNLPSKKDMTLVI